MVTQHFFYSFCRIASDQRNKKGVPSLYIISYEEGVFHLPISA